MRTEETMKRAWRIGVVGLLLSSMGCGAGTDAPSDPSTPMPTETAVVDETAPDILSTSPEDGAVGQTADVEVVLVFSEPMVAETVAGALDTASLGEVDLLWNDVGDTLTIAPREPLVYAFGVGEEAVEAASYDVTLGTGATDRAGNPVEQGVQVVFSTMRELAATLAPDPALTRSLTPTTVLYTADDPLVVGDTYDDEAVRTALSFDLSALPSEAVEVVEATLATRQLLGDLEGSPWTDLGSEVLMDHVTFAAPLEANAVFNASQGALGTHAGLFVEGQVVVDLDVTSDVDDDLQNRDEREERSQFLLRYPTFTDQDGLQDRAVLSRELLELQLVYLVP